MAPTAKDKAIGDTGTISIFNVLKITRKRRGNVANKQNIKSIMSKTEQGLELWRRIGDCFDLTV